jgi:hypothetical protein
MKYVQLSRIFLLVLLLATSLVHASENEHFVDVSIQVFTQAQTPPDPHADKEKEKKDKEKLAPKADPVQAVLVSETRLLPMYLRYRLEDSGSFGAVRVLPIIDNGAELRISGQILKSDGHVLQLAIKAVDSTGRVWLDRTFAGTGVSSRTLSENPLAEDDFAQLFGEITAALKQQAQQLNAAELNKIRNVALLRYGLGLIPAAFSPYLEESAAGVVTLKRLPANGDPLLQRILNIREREYKFIDVVDEEYTRFYAAAKPLYAQWRQAQREQAESSETRNERALADNSGFARGSYRALQQSYNNYRWAKLQELYVDELGEGFTNEIEPTELQTNDALFKLTGTFEQQYREWRSILAELFALDSQ